MKLLLRLGMCATLLCSLLAGVVNSLPAVATGTGVDFWNLPALLGQLDDLKRQQAELAARGDVLLGSLEAKRRLAREVARGHITLTEAAAAFRDRSACQPSYPERLRRSYPGRSDGERYCRQAIDYVWTELHEQPDQAAVVARLEAELQTCLERDGGVVLPE